MKTETEKIWKTLYDAAKAVQHERKISDMVTAGEVAGNPCGQYERIAPQIKP